MAGFYDDDGVMMGAVNIDESQFEMGAVRRRGGGRRGTHPTMILPIAFDPVTFLAANGTNNVLRTLTPDVPYAVAQMFASINRNGGAAPFVFMTSLQVGPTPVLLNGATDLGRYVAGAFHNNFRLPPTGIGQSYKANFALSTPLTGTDSISLYVEFHGQAKLSPGFVLHSR